MQTTISDFSRFVQAVVNGKGLHAFTWREMLTPQVKVHSRHQFPTLETETTNENDAIGLSYGLGWGLYSSPHGKAFFKEGHDEGWRNYAVCFEVPRDCLIIMTNSGNGEGIFQYLLEELLADTYTPIEWEGYTPYDRLPPRKPLAAHKAVQVDGTVLVRYAGTYALDSDPKILLTIRREGDRLSVQENDEPKQDLLAESETLFFSTVADDVYRFEAETNGEVNKMVLHTDGKDLPLHRVKAK